jgi:hypothetical protein
LPIVDLDPYGIDLATVIPPAGDRFYRRSRRRAGDYLGRDMRLARTGVGISKADYAAFMRCLCVTLDTFKVPQPERTELVTFALSLETEIAEA